MTCDSLKALYFLEENRSTNTW